MAKHSISSSAARSNVRKQTKSRKRLHMTKIEDPAALQTAFSKRRNGLFKKAGQLSALCGVEASVLVFSPYGRPFLFSPYGRPFGISPEGGSTALHGGGQDMDRNTFDTESSTILQSNSVLPNSEDQTTACQENINLTLGGGGDLGLVREEEAAGKEAGNKFWWDQPFEKMNLRELKEFQASLKGLRDNLTIYSDERKIRDLALRDFLAINYN